MVSKHWEDATGGISCIENLSLEGNHLWRKVQVTLRGKKIYYGQLVHLQRK